MNLSSREKRILIKRKFRRFIKFMFGLIFRSITYFLVFARHYDENMVKVGGRWFPTEEELKLVKSVKAYKKSQKVEKQAKKQAEKQKNKDSKKIVSA